MAKLYRAEPNMAEQSRVEPEPEPEPDKELGCYRTGSIVNQPLAYVLVFCHRLVIKYEGSTTVVGNSMPFKRIQHTDGGKYLTCRQSLSQSYCTATTLDSTVE